MASAPVDIPTGADLFREILCMAPVRGRSTSHGYPRNFGAHFDGGGGLPRYDCGRAAIVFGWQLRLIRSAGVEARR